MPNGVIDRQKWEPVFFFFISVGYTIGWTTLSSMLASFKDRFGPSVLLQLNLAYFLPSIPILFLQTQYDSIVDRKFGLPRSSVVRMIIGLGGSGLLCAVFPFLDPTLKCVLVVTTLLGICCGIAFASSYQLVSHFGARCSKALTIGFVGSGPIVLGIQLVDHIGPQPAQSQRIVLYMVAAFFAFAGLAAAFRILSWNWDRLILQGSEQSYLNDKEAGDCELGRNDYVISSAHSATSNPSGQAIYRPLKQRSEGSEPESQEGWESSSSFSQDSSAPESSMQDLLCQIWPAAAALGVSVGCATLLFPFFTFVPSSGRLKSLLPQVLFFTRTMADILGRFIPHSWLPRTKKGLHAMTLVKLAAMPLGFWYIMASPTHSDVLVIVYVFLFWLQSGAVNSVSFVLAENWSSSAMKGKAGGCLALAFQLGCLVALGIAFVLERYCSPFKSEWR